MVIGLHLNIITANMLDGKDVCFIAKAYKQYCLSKNSLPKGGGVFCCCGLL
jgi:hypothetical protein